MSKDDAFYIRLGEFIIRLLKEYLGGILLAILIGLTIRAFIIEAFRLPSIVMKPTLQPGDLIFSVKWPFGLRFGDSAKPLINGRQPRHGEVITYALPEEADHNYIKRVIAVEGETIAIKDVASGSTGNPCRFTPGSPILFVEKKPTRGGFTKSV